jgi:hypothetical protein
MGGLLIVIQAAAWTVNVSVAFSLLTISSPMGVPAATFFGRVRRVEEGRGNSDEDIEEAWTRKAEIE